MPIVIDPSAGITGLVTPLAVLEGGNGNATGNVTSSQVADALNATGSAPLYACRAWANFNGTGTVAIRASGNVSSITDTGVGDYSVNFTTAMPDVNYCAVASSARDTSASQVGTFVANTSASIVQVRELAGLTFYDSANMAVTVFR